MTRYTLLFFLIYMPLNLIAQIKGPNHIGSIGSMGIKNLVFSGPIIINDSSCFTISNGVKAIIERPNTDFFRLNCEVLYNNQSQVILFNTYPNPTSNYTILNFIKKEGLYSLNEEVGLRLYDNSGNLFSVFKTTIFEISNGYKINISNLFSGNYYLLIQFRSSNYNQIIKIYKN